MIYLSPQSEILLQEARESKKPHILPPKPKEEEEEEEKWQYKWNVVLNNYQLHPKEIKNGKFGVMVPLKDIVYVTRSKIKNAGDGLFAKTKLGIYHIIGIYGPAAYYTQSELQVMVQVMTPIIREKFDTYAYGTARSRIIISTWGLASSILSKINSAPEKENNNVCFMEVYLWGIFPVVFVVTTKIIEEQEELLIYYGDQYWEPLQKSRQKSQDWQNILSDCLEHL